VLSGVIGGHACNNLATGNTLEWYVGLDGGITITISGGNNNSGNTAFNTVRIAPGYTAA